MSKIEELIKKLCPEGVKFIRLGDYIKVLRGRRLTTRDIIEDGEYPVYHGGIIPIGMYDKSNRKANTTMIINVGASAGSVGYSDVDFWSSDGCFCLEQNDIYNNRFLYHLMLTKEKLLQSKVRKAGIPTLDNKIVENLILPVPPLEVQCEIVHVLDDFTLLSAELSAELKAREKQYNFYKEKLLTFSEKDTNIEWVSLGTYCKRLRGTAITAGKMKEIAEENGNVKVFAGGKTMIFTDESNIPSEDIIRVPNIIVQSRGIIDFIYYDKPCSYKREMWSYTLENTITLKYIYYYLKNNVEYFRQRGSQMGSMPQISLDVTEKYKIPIPDIKEQERIVNILDRFDKLCNDISEGLPAEIEARQKQYEYYRDKLITFKELLNEG